ncbi:hypothetical protein APHAL10511_007408 [Amanita phalloides]|nr:hypothetical protein APHAL10511_007408 [Amanita phalloides]
MVYEPPTEKPVWQRMKFSVRALAYGITFFLIFALTVAELGLVSEQMHIHGNSAANYPTLQYKNVIGILLFSSIATLLFALTHFWASVSSIPFISLILAVFWGVGAGLLRTGTPYRGTNCTTHAHAKYPPAFQPFAGLCKKVVTIQAIAWTEWALLIMLMVGSLAHKLTITAKPTPEEMYFEAPEEDAKF